VKWRLGRIFVCELDLLGSRLTKKLGHNREAEIDSRGDPIFLKRPGGQAQFSATLALQHSDARFERLHAWICDNLRGDLSVAALAGAASMSERSFIRHYRRSTGTTPARAIERIRVEAARQVLEQGLPVKRVVARCGFGSEETMRRSFLRLLGATPRAYRERFASESG
jgi:transcriptional regulator GlxA family with amidase domain